MNIGSPYCRECGGAGGYWFARGWYKCACTRVTAEQRRVQQRTAELRTGRKPLTVSDMLRVGSSERRANGS